MEEADRRAERLRQQQEQAIYAIRWQQAHLWLLTNVPIENIKQHPTCVRSDNRIGVNRKHGVYVCFTHGCIHICGSDPCDATLPSAGQFVCLFSHTDVEQMISRYGDMSKKDPTRIESLDALEEWKTGPRQRKVAGSGSTLDSAVPTIEKILVNLFCESNLRSQGLAEMKKDRRTFPSDWCEPPRVEKVLPWLRILCLKMWQIMERNGSGTMTTTRCRDVTLYTISRIAEGDFVVTCYLIASTCSWIRKYAPDAELISKMCCGYTPNMLSSGKRNFLRAFHVFIQKPGHEEFLKSIPIFTDEHINS